MSNHSGSNAMCRAFFMVGLRLFVGDVELCRLATDGLR
jgi:hypothetical protein